MPANVNARGDGQFGVAPSRPVLSAEQLQSLRSCADGISLRFEKWEIVTALLSLGFVEKNFAGVIRVTPAGHEYLRSEQARTTSNPDVRRHRPG